MHERTKFHKSLNTFGVQRMTILTIDKEYTHCPVPNQAIATRLYITLSSLKRHGISSKCSNRTVFSLHHLCTALVHWCMVQNASRYDGKCTKWPRFCLRSSAVGTPTIRGGTDGSCSSNDSFNTNLR